MYLKWDHLDGQPHKNELSPIWIIEGDRKVFFIIIDKKVFGICGLKNKMVAVVRDVSTSHTA